MSITDFITPTPVSEAGGKGHNLKRLTAMGFKVPGGVVIGASFYRQHFQPPPLFNYEDETILAEQCRAMRESILSRQLPADVAANINNALTNYDAKTRFAVRSSSTFEDLASAAFAGQHDTYLNIPPEEVPTAVQRCFASLWTPHAVLYRRHHGFAQEETAMAVVIQQMLSPDSSGVAFSVDPVGGNLNHVLIEANFGVGESVVGGEAITDSWIVDHAQGYIADRRINCKECQVVLTEQGVEEQKVPEAKRDTPALCDADILRLTAIVKKIEFAYGAPQDVEWALADNTLFILQSRPQTKIPPHFTRDESAERFPEPLTPLTWSYVEEAFNISLEHSLGLMGINLPTRPWFARINSYIYGNQNAVRLLALNRPVDMSGFEQLREQLPSLRERFQWVIDLPNRWASDLDDYLLAMGRLNAANFSTFTTSDFQNFFRELFHVSSDYFRPNIAISMIQSFLTRTLFEFLTLISNDPVAAQGLMKGIIADCGSKTGQVNMELFMMARMVKKDPELLACLARGGGEAVREIDSFPEFAAKFQRFLESYGHRETTFDYYKPTWGEAPEVVLDLLHVIATSEQGEHTENREHEVLVRKVECLRQVMRQTPDDLQPFADELIRLTRQFAWLDDIEHFQTTRINPMVRRVIGAFGHHLGLGDPYDLFFLTRPEIETITGDSLSGQLAELIEKRRQEYLDARQVEPLWDLRADDNNYEEAAGEIKGVPGSPGVVEGEAYLVRGVEDFPGMPQSAVLVARTTNPSWTPLFYKCSGLITESGGPLSHGAVTARELGIPAVMFIRGALSRFKNGDRLRVDGQKGVVVVGEPDPE